MKLFNPLASLAYTATAVRSNSSDLQRKSVFMQMLKSFVDKIFWSVLESFWEFEINEQ